MFIFMTLIFFLLAVVVVLAFVKQRNQRGHFDD